MDIRQSETVDEIMPALVAAQSQMHKVMKGGENQFDRYSYATLEDYLRAASEALRANKLGLVTSAPEVVDMEPRQTKKGGIEHAARVRLTLRLIHQSGQWVETIAWGEGQDRADKTIYKAITGARKYGVACLLSLVTTDDPEADETVGQSEGVRQAVDAPRAEPRQERSVFAEVGSLFTAFFEREGVDWQADKNAALAAFVQWATNVTGEEGVDFSQRANWTSEHVAACRADLEGAQ